MSDVLRTRRKSRGMTQEQLGSLVGADKRTISDLERGVNTNPSWRVVCRMARVLELQPDELFPVEHSTAA
jgi:transcriptional regulator with XRE-family HTH domain